MKFYNNSCIDSLYCILDKCVEDGEITPGSLVDFSFNIRSPEFTCVFSSKNSWENTLRDSFIIYIVNGADLDIALGVMTAESINSISESIILAKYHLVYDEIKQLNYTFYFPPDERMKDISMWPPYEKVIAQYGD